MATVWPPCGHRVATVWPSCGHRRHLFYVRLFITSLAILLACLRARVNFARLLICQPACLLACWLAGWLIGWLVDSFLCACGAVRFLWRFAIWHISPRRVRLRRAGRTPGYYTWKAAPDMHAVRQSCFTRVQQQLSNQVFTWRRTTRCKLIFPKLLPPPPPQIQCWVLGANRLG